MARDTAKDTPVKCIKCGHENDPARRRCSECDAHLYVTCPECGRGNERAERKCRFCDTRLHRSWFKRLRSRVFGRLSPEQTVGVVFALALLVLCLIVLKMLWNGPEGGGSTPEPPMTIK